MEKKKVKEMQEKEGWGGGGGAVPKQGGSGGRSLHTCEDTLAPAPHAHPARPA